MQNWWKADRGGHHEVFEYIDAMSAKIKIQSWEHLSSLLIPHSQSASNMAKKTGNKSQRADKAPAHPEVDQYAIKNILTKLQFNVKRDLECRVVMDDQILVIDVCRLCYQLRSASMTSFVFTVELAIAQRMPGCYCGC